MKICWHKWTPWQAISKTLRPVRTQLRQMPQGSKEGKTMTNYQLRQILYPTPSLYRRSERALRSLAERLANAVFGTVERLLD